MSRTATCPSCGAPVVFKSVASILAVCEYCQSTLVRRGEDLEDLGKMAALLEDRSPLQRGAEGSWRGLHFALIGRIQLKWEAGLWNEWHLLFDDGKSGWLSESGGEYVISEPKRSTDTLPAFDELRPGQRHALAGQVYSVTNVLTAECIAGEGELPFTVGAGYPARSVDLRDEAGRFATLDYSDNADRPLLFVGESVAFKSLGWNGLRENIPLPKPTIKVRAFNCPSCGAPLTVSHDDIVTVGCGSCGAVLDAANERVKVIAKASEQLRAQPILDLGTKGRLRGEEVEVIGFIHRHATDAGTTYYWSEYLLLGPDNKLLWLTEYDGHWNLARVLPKALRAVGGTVRYEQEQFKHFASYTAIVDYVIGEFPWRVAMDERAKVHDYVAPPRMLSLEATPGEETWTLAEYISPQEIAAALKTRYPVPEPIGVYANQVNPHWDSHDRVLGRFIKFLGLALVVHFLLLWFGPAAQMVDRTVEFSPGDEETRLVADIHLDHPVSRLQVSHDTTVDNNWVAVNATLANKDTGENWTASREIARYSGVEDGESWSEGSRGDEVYFANLPAGNYVLALESDMEPGARPVRDRVRVSRPGPRWPTLFLFVVFLVAFPIYTGIRKRAFEVRRWAESDHPMITYSADGDD